MADLNRKEYRKFEEIKHLENDVEFWYARKIMEVLEYTKWKIFLK